MKANPFQRHWVVGFLLRFIETLANMAESHPVTIMWHIFRDFFTVDSGWAFNDVSYRVHYHSWLVVLQGKLSGIARRGWYRSVWEKAPCLIDLYVMAIEIKIEYSYYSTKRITPVYIVEEELMSLEYSKFVERIVNEVRHLRRMNSLPLTVKEDETVDA